MKLLDVNVWLAATWDGHEHHVAARRWLDETQDELVFCRVTQMGLLRLVTNPAVMQRDAVSRQEAWELVERFMADPRARFLSEPEGLLPLWITLSKRDDRNHQLWTDDYLAAFAHAVNAELVTFDRAFRGRYPAVRIIVLG